MDDGDYQGLGTKLQSRNAEELWKHGGVLKEGFLLNIFKERAEQGTCMLEALRQNLWPQTQSVVSHSIHCGS